MSFIKNNEADIYDAADKPDNYFTSRGALRRHRVCDAADKGNGGPHTGRHNSNCVCVTDGPFRPDVAISATSLWTSLQFPERSINSTFCLGLLYLRRFRLDPAATIHLLTGRKKYGAVTVNA